MLLRRIATALRRPVEDFYDPDAAARGRQRQELLALFDGLCTQVGRQRAMDAVRAAARAEVAFDAVAERRPDPEA